MRIPPILAILLALLGAASLAPASHAGVLRQKPATTYVAFEATTVTIDPGTPESWVSSNLVSSAGGTALYSSGSNSTADSPHSFAHYRIQFLSAGSYFLYYRWKADETRTSGDNATANSCWIGTTFGDYNTRGDQVPFYRSDSNNKTAPADNAFTWQKEPTATYTVGAGELAAPVTFTIGSREAGMALDRIVFSTEASLTDVQLDALSYELGQVRQGTGDNFAAFSADGPVLVFAGTPETWVSSNVVNAAGGTALYSAGANSTADSPHSFAQYEIAFKTAGTYSLYYRWKADESRTAGDNATANSSWIATTFGEYAKPADQTTYFRSDSNNKTAPADNTFSWQREPTATYAVGPAELSGLVRFTLATREAGMILDRFVFSTETALTDAQLDALSDSGTQPPAPEPATAVGSDSLTVVTLTFTRPLAPGTVNPAAFTFSPTLSVTATALDADDARIVRLTTTAQAEGTRYSIAMSGIKDTSGTSMKAGTAINFSAWKTVSGWVRLDIYQGITGATVADLSAASKYPDKPDITRFIRGFQYKRSGAFTDVGIRVSAWLTPPSAGSYDLFVNNDDEAEIFLSSDATDAGLGSLGVLPLHAAPFADGVSVSTPDLASGRKYLLRAVVKQGGGDAVLEIGARRGGASSPEAALIPVVSGNLISTLVNPDLGVVTFDAQPATATAAAGSRARFAVKAKAPGSPIYYQWRVNGADIPGATRPAYVTPELTNADDAKSYDVVVSVAGVSTASQPAKLTVTPGEPSNLRPYVGVNFIGGGYVSEDAVSLAPADVAGAVLQENWNNLGNSLDPVPLTDARGAATPVTLALSLPTGTAPGMWSSGTRFSGDADGDLLQGFINNGISTDPVTLSFAGVPSGTYQVLAYTMGFDFQANYQESFTLQGTGSYPTYHGLGETGLDFSQGPGYRRITNTDASVHPRGNYVQFDNVRPAADGTLTLIVQYEATTGGSYNPAINAVQLIQVLPVTAKPRLSFTGAASALTLAWDATAAGFTLQSSPALGSGALWTTVAGSPSPIAGAGSMPVTSGNPATRFFRLVKN